MKKTITTTYCDICGIEGAKSIKTTVRFLTEQTEGKYVTPYYELKTLDLCDECLDKVILIDAAGAQGNNKYRIRRKRVKNNE